RTWRWEGATFAGRTTIACRGPSTAGRCVPDGEPSVERVERDARGRIERVVTTVAGASPMTVTLTYDERDRLLREQTDEPQQVPELRWQYECS
ncbi:MAG: hypothetical protein M3Y87_34980, partial [Myxococcota bacterium]|nr:hypothetical protein [Myxococcota bacterium]